MRCVLLVVLLPIAAVAAPRPALPPSAPAAQPIGLQVYNVAHYVKTNYIRPVPVPALVQAALVGIYEAARVPVPTDLPERVEKAAARATLVQLIDETQLRTGPALIALGRDPMTVACKAMLRSLDPYRGIIGKDEQRRDVAMDQEAQGVGIDIFGDSGDGQIVVKTVHPGGAAQRAGVRPGDLIDAVDGIQKPSTYTRARLLGIATKGVLKLNRSPLGPHGSTSHSGIAMVAQRQSS